MTTSNTKDYDLTFDSYQSAATATAIYPGQGEIEGLMYAALGLAGEAGEVANKVKKVWRDDSGFEYRDNAFGGMSLEYHDKLKKDLQAELGDIVWYLSAVANELGVSLEQAAHDNLAKLESRQRRGVLGGSGDVR